MMQSPSITVLRDVQVQKNTQTLPRAPRAEPKPAPQEAPIHAPAAADAQAPESRAVTETLAHISVSAQSVAEAYEQARRDGYAEGFAHGKREGHADGEREGHEAGLRAGREQADQAVQEKFTALDVLARELQSRMTEHLKAAEDDMVETVFAALCEVIGTVAGTPELSREAVRNLILKYQPRQTTAIRVHPDTMNVLGSAVLNGKLAWIADDTLTPGGCVIESEQGNVDCRLEIQLARVAETLVAVRASRKSEEGPPE